MHKKKIIIVIIVLLIIFFMLELNLPEKVLKIIYPIKYDSFIDLYAQEYEVDKYLIYAIIKAESNFNENAVSSKGAKGLMQLMDNTAKYVIEANGGNSISSDISTNVNIVLDKNISINLENVSENLLKPEVNIMLGTKYISILINKYNSVELALVAYNAGSGNVDNWIEQGILKEDGSNLEDVPYKETNNYVRKILRDYKVYKDLYI